MLINSYAQRMEMREKKFNQILKFLRDETWSSPKVLQLVLGVSAPCLSKTMMQLESEKFVIRHTVLELRQVVWGITSHGLAFAWAEDEQMQNRPYFEPSRLSPLIVMHHLDVQIARQRAEQVGWREWLPDARLEKGLKKRPDAIAIDIEGRRVAVELERHIKTIKRYESIFSEYLQMIRAGKIDIVHYVCPSEKLAKQLQRVFTLITAVPVMGERVALNEKHRARLIVFGLDNWPPR